jgi:CRISPR-associated endonuclease/helicase Cas3
MSEERKYYAHSFPGVPAGPQWQELHVHLAAVAERAAQYAHPFQSDDWAYNAGWLHDIGKADGSFQAYLLRSNGLDDTEYDGSGRGRVNHSSAGAALADAQLGQCPGRTLAYLAAGHHAGLPDLHGGDTGAAALTARLQEGWDNIRRINDYANDIVTNLRTLTRPPAFVKPEHFHLWMRMLFSCLVDADFLDTEAFMSPEAHAVRAPFKTLEELKTLFDEHMAEMAAQASETPVNKIRQEVLTACRAMAQESPGLFSLSVPTGGGKTLSGMAFALDHAVRHGKDRIIYVIPYTSIIEQTAQVLSDIFGAENVVEHHSNLDPERETQRSRLAAENWDAPIIITTNVQFFESLYAARPSRCRKLHNIVNSVVILDEAQLLPPHLLTPCVKVMNHLTRHYGVTLLLSTATQPALRKLDTPREIIPDRAALYSQLKRTDFHFPAAMHETTEWETLALELKQHDQVLCIVNTRSDCHTLFCLMPEGTIHLSALMCGQHRSKVIATIKKRLRDGEPIRVISTQLVEAGVDIDFPVVYRALAGLDSIAQAAGRCNREGKLNARGRNGQVHVFVPPKPAPRGLLRKGEDTTRELRALSDFDPDHPGEFTRYFELFYGKVNDTGTKYNDWLVRDVPLDIHFRTAAQEFQFIDDQAQRPVFVRFQGSETLLRQFAAVGPKRDIMRKLQRYTVNVSSTMAARMLADGLLEELRPGFLAQAMPSLYDETIGLNIYRENHPVEDLVT